MIADVQEAGLTNREKNFLLRIYRDCVIRGLYVTETLLRDDRPIPEGTAIAGLIEKGLIKAGRGRCGPLGIYIGVYVVSLTETGTILAKLLADPE